MRHVQLKTKSNPKYFFTYARKKLKTRNKIGPFEINGEYARKKLKLETKEDLLK